jgi:homoserine O-acetyltransferase
MAKIFHIDEPFVLESGKRLSHLHLAYTTHGKLNDKKDNVIWVFHALTANSDPAEWWPGLVGEDCLFSPKKYFIICVNMPGSCYGSISPLDVNPKTNEKYYHHFPWFTTRDMIKAYKFLKEDLGITKINIGIGGSMGGQQLLEWAIEEPQLFEHIIPIATNAQHSPWGIAFNSSQRLCIEADATWKNKTDDAGIEGMKVARSLALISYRHYETYLHSQQGFTEHTKDNLVDTQIFNAESYQRYQGEKLAKRFNAFSYYFLSKGMDSHNVGRAKHSVKKALQTIIAKTLVIGITSDILYPVSEQELLAEYIPNASFKSIISLFGHDGFLLEDEQLTRLIKEFLEKNKPLSDKKFSFVLE